MADRRAKRVLIIGWDAADWKVIDPLLAGGKMGNLRRLIDAGVRADLSSLDPKLSPLLWTSIATGKTPDKHGILNFVEPDTEAGGLRPALSPTRRTKALWNILTQAGMSTNVVSWYASHPAEPVRGCIVSNLFQEGLPAASKAPWPIPAGAVHPTSKADAIARARVRPSGVNAAHLRVLVPGLASVPSSDPRLGLLTRQLAQCASVQAVADLLLKSDRSWDCTMVFFEAIDVVGHHFMQYYPPRMEHVGEADFERYRHVMAGIYQVQDEMLGRLLNLAGPDTTVIVLSDHGFHSDHLRPRNQASVDDAHAAMDATWHRPHGMLVMSGPGIARGATVHAPGLLDITPTVLALLGLAAGADMDGRVLREALAGVEELPRIASWDDEPGEAGMHPPDKRIDPFEAHQAMKQMEDLGYLAGASEKTKAAMDLADRETRFNLGVVYMTTGRPGPAGGVFERLHAEHTGEQRFAMNLARCWYTTGRHAEALRILDAVMAAAPESADARLLRGTLLLARGDLGPAVTALEQAAERSPERIDVLGALADAYGRQERWGDAERTLERACSIDPHSPGPHLRRALLEIDRGRFEEAAEHALTALERRHLQPEAHYALGVALAWLGNLDYAAKSFDIALSMQPGMLDAHRFAAGVRRRLGQSAEARSHEEAVARLEAGRPEGLVRQESSRGPERWEREMGQGARG